MGKDIIKVPFFQLNAFKEESLHAFDEVKEKFKIIAKPNNGYYENGALMEDNILFYSSFSHIGVNQLLNTAITMAKNDHLTTLDLAVFDQNNHLCSVSNISKDALKEINQTAFENIIMKSFGNVDDQMETHWLKILSTDKFINDAALEIDELMYELNSYEYLDQYDSRMNGFESTKTILMIDSDAIQNELLSYIESFDSTEIESIYQIQNIINLVDLVSFVLEKVKAKEIRKPSLSEQMAHSQSKGKEKTDPRLNEKDIDKNRHR